MKLKIISALALLLCAISLTVTASATSTVSKDGTTVTFSHETFTDNRLIFARYGMFVTESDPEVGIYPTYTSSLSVGLQSDGFRVALRAGNLYLYNGRVYEPVTLQGFTTSFPDATIRAHGLGPHYDAAYFVQRTRNALMHTVLYFDGVRVEMIDEPLLVSEFVLQNCSVDSPPLYDPYIGGDIYGDFGTIRVDRHNAASDYRFHSFIPAVSNTEAHFDTALPRPMSATITDWISHYFGSTSVTIDGGTYKGSPAVNGSNVTVKKGTFTDIGGTTSTYLIDPESEVSNVTTSGDQTITTVKLSNPPIIIDWEDFPGIDLDIDLSAPVIEVIRNPASLTTPTRQVTLTVKATDPNGADSPTPISINGGAFQANNATYTVTENQTVSIVARDNNGNIREYNVVINNIDSQAPEVLGFTQSNSEWTKDPVRVYINATDDVKLNLTPYKYTFTPNDGSAATTTGWVSSRSFLATKSGTLTVAVRDTLGQETTSDPYYIRNIDNIAPTATYEISPPSGTVASASDGVTISLNIQNTADPVTYEASALSELAVRWNSTEAWTSDLTRTVHENGTFNVQVRDSVGNVSSVIPIRVNNISTAKPVINGLTANNMTGGFVQAPVTITVDAAGSGSTGLADKPYSWDGGNTWTSLDEYDVYQNGEYTVMVKDEIGNIIEDSIIISNIDNVAPTASVYFYRGLPEDATPDMTVDDYVWKIRVEANDVGSGVDRIETLWDNGTHSTLPITQDVYEPGVYGIIVYDQAGNQTYAEKVVTYESLGESGSGSNGAYVEVQVPSEGTAGDYWNSSIGDMVYGPTGAYNKVTGEFKTYQASDQGITAHLIVNARSGRYVSGYATFNSVRYPVTFAGGATSVRGGRNIEAQVHIPADQLTTDVRNGRLIVVFQEWKDSSLSELQREGSATLYTSVQVSEPKINYTYNRATDELTMAATSSVAGLYSSTYNIGSGNQNYTAPFTVGGAGSITLTAVDNVRNTTTITLDGDDLPLAGEGGGSLPTEGIRNPGSINSYYSASRSAEIYIIGGTRSNTENLPGSNVFSNIMGGSGG